MMILWALSSPNTLRYVSTMLSELADRGHDVRVAYRAESWVTRLGKGVTPLDWRVRAVGTLPARKDVWAEHATRLRGTMDFVRLLDRRYADAAALRARIAATRLPPPLAALDALPASFPPETVATALAGLATLEELIPLDARLVAYLEALHPDVVVVTNLVDSHVNHVDVVRAARQLGIPTVYVVLSWDHLVNRGHIHVQPDSVLVWNETMRAEAVTYHGVAEDRVAVVGAPRYDSWFGQTPMRTRAEFLAAAGLPDRPFVLFAGSSQPIIALEREIAFVRQWATALRGVGATLVVRPHPEQHEAWRRAGTDLTLRPVQHEEYSTSFFETLYHATAVVGINTSVMVEATILGKPVLTVLDPALVDAQDGALHFRYLRRAGFLRVAEAFDAHASQLRAAMDDPTTAAGEALAFARSFFRPNGLDVRCAPLAADAIERSAA